MAMRPYFVLHPSNNYYSFLNDRPNGRSKFYLAREVKVWHIVKDRIRSYKQNIFSD